MNSSTEVAGIDWSAARIIPAFQAPQHLSVYDIRSASRDTQLSVTTMAGLINRLQPQIYLINSEDDIFWFNESLASVPHDSASASNNDILDALLTAYRSSVQGMIIFDPDFIDSINIATTMAGQRDGIVVSPEQAGGLQQGPHKLPVLADLRTYHWHTRLHAYYWAQQNLLSNASTRLIAGLDPNNVTGLRSFLVATRTFVYWLDSRLPLPDPSLDWASERTLMQQMLQALPPGATHLGWFIDEPSGVCLTSEAAKAVLATDLFTNLEVWTGVQPPAALTKQASPVSDKQVTSPESKVYVSFTISDGDNLQYSQHRMLRLWRDAARGSLPIGWTISPVLQQAAPGMAAYYTHTATSNDEFIAGPSGAGYMFPSRWPVEQLPAFLQRTGQLMQDMNLALLEVLDVNFFQRLGLSFLTWLGRAGMTFTDETLQEQFVQALLPFGMRGLLSGAGLSKPAWSVGSTKVPVYQNLGLADSVSGTLGLIQNAASDWEGRPLFLNVYILAWSMTPSDLKQVVAQLDSEYEVVKPGTLLTLLAQSQSGTQAL
jgi:hypothetical protein